MELPTGQRGPFWLRERLIIAIDTADMGRARDLALVVAPYCKLIKLGLEFYLSRGWQDVRRIASPKSIFLDLKLHDIPTTVAKAVRGLVRDCGPGIISVHGSGGLAMVAAAKQAALQSDSPPLIAAVTRLTSLPASLDDTSRVAEGAVKGGADCLICSPLEIRHLRDQFGGEVKLICPGIRVTDAARQDQARTMPPLDAVETGATWIVVGRPITSAPDPARAARELFNHG